jgi:hypothetical protein
MTAETEKHEVLIAKDGSCMIFVATPRECPICHVMRGILINRDGRTRCWECDGRYRDGCAAGRIHNPIIAARHESPKPSFNSPDEWQAALDEMAREAEIRERTTQVSGNGMDCTAGIDMLGEFDAA